MPPLVIDGIPTPVEKMTQAQLRAFIPLMLKYSTGKKDNIFLIIFLFILATKFFFLIYFMTKKVSNNSN